MSDYLLQDLKRRQEKLVANTTYVQRMERLVEVVQELSQARQLDEITAIVRLAARQLLGADGASFVLNEGDLCFYADEDAIQPLWKGKRFPQSICIGGWCMRKREQVMIEDVYQDDRIPIEAYRPTFVKSLVMVPIRTANPIGAIGAYWATPHKATPEEVQLIQALADTTSVSMENLQVYTELEQRVKARTAELKIANEELVEVNQELRAFAYTLSHDLRSPLTTIKGYASLAITKLTDSISPIGAKYLGKIKEQVNQMNTQIEEMLSLYHLNQMALTIERVNLTNIARYIMANLQANNPEREVIFEIENDLIVDGDKALLTTVLDNLLSNAWKYTSKRPLAQIKFFSQLLDNIWVYYVQDNGAGFNIETAQNLFLPFQRMHGEDEFPGHGIGLASAKRIIQKHGGKMWADATVDGGATFYFTLKKGLIS